MASGLEALARGRDQRPRYRDRRSTSFVRLSDEQLELYCRGIELRVQPALEAQRGESVGFFGLACIVSLRVVRSPGSRELSTRLRPLELHLLAFL